MLSVQQKFKFGEIFQQTCNNVAKESYNLHLFLKRHKKTYSFHHHVFSVATRNSSAGKLVSNPERQMGLPGKIDDVMVKWEKDGSYTRYPHTDLS